MATPVTDYVLRLARDRQEAEKFKTSHASAKQSMTAAGLDEQQQELVLSGDANRLGEAMQSEMSVHAQVNAAYNNVQCKMTIPIPHPPKQ